MDSGDTDADTAAFWLGVFNIILVPELVLVLAMMTGRPSCQLTLSASHLGSAINPPPDINLFQLFTGWQNKHGIPVMEVV